jgi:hypothetical protein
MKGGLKCPVEASDLRGRRVEAQWHGRMGVMNGEEGGSRWTAVKPWRKADGWDGWRRGGGRGRGGPGCSLGRRRKIKTHRWRRV